MAKQAIGVDDELFLDSWETEEYLPGAVMDIIHRSHGFKIAFQSRWNYLAYMFS